MIRIGIIGMGIRGEMYAQGLDQNQDAVLAAICDIQPKVVTAAAQKWDVPGYSDYKTLVNHSKLDALIICTPDFAHSEPALYACEKNIHMLIEKPLATTGMDAERIRDAVRKNNVICQLAFENRWNPPFVRIKSAIRDGELGEIRIINARLDDTIWVPTQMIPWAGKTTVGWFLLPHLLDLAIWLSGKSPLKVYAVANKGHLSGLGIDTYDSILTTVSFEGGMETVFQNSWVLPESSPAVYDFRFAIYGEQGAAHINSQEQMIHQFTDRFTYPGSLNIDIHGKTRGFPLYMLDSFVEAVKNQETPLATVDDGLLVTRVVEAVHRSIKLEQPVFLS